jgi:Terminase large subunit, T4likevirus-type, N-terminal
MSEQDNIKEIIKQEFIKCAQDPVYFMKKYYWIQHPQRGRIQFNLYPFQAAVLKQLQKNRYSVVNKSRQLGISTLSSAYSLWIMLFNKDRNILCIATKQETAKNMVTKVKFAYDNLPTWLKIKAIENNKLSLKLSNGSQIKAVGATGDAGRSEAVSLLLLDEAAFIEGIDEIFASAQQTLATGGQCIAISTPYGTGNWFHKTFTGAEAGSNGFVAIKLPWTVHPERNQKWRDEQDAILGPRNAAQECDCDFSTSGDTVISPDILNWYIETYQKDPIAKGAFDGNLWRWEYPDFTRAYAVIADVARGDGKDYSACHVIDIEEAKQVAEYKGQISTRDYGNFLVGLAAEYNDALLVIENASIGWDVVQTAIDRGYHNLYYSSKSDTANTNIENYIDRLNNGNLIPGFTNSQKTRPLIVSKLEAYMREKAVIVQSRRSLEELRTFVWKNGKAQALDGYNDDLTMALGIGLFLRDTALRFQQTGLDLTRASLGGINKVNYLTSAPMYTPSSIGPINPWQINIGNNQVEDISWLI